MITTVIWSKLGYPKCPIPKYTPGYARLVWEWYRDQGYAVPRTGAEYSLLLAGRGLPKQLSKVRYRPGVPKPDDIPKYTMGYAKVRRGYQQNDALLSLPTLSSKQKHFVYEYIRPDNNTCFYVGCGRGKRHLDISSRSDEFKYIVMALRTKGLEPIVNIVDKDLMGYEARELEMKTIVNYVINGHKLVNRMFVIGGIFYFRDDDGIWHEERKTT
jgi:hypothetical protein